jgi:bacterioferritin (cytochrome b1)
MNANSQNLQAQLLKISKNLNDTGPQDSQKMLCEMEIVLSDLNKDAEYEGALAAPVGEVINHLNNWIADKYAIDIAYRNFSDRIPGPYRDGIADHFNDHAKEERGHAYDLNMIVIGLNSDPIQTMIRIPSCPSNIQGFISTLISMELKAVQAGRKAIELAGDLTSLKVTAENILNIDTQHLNDLRRFSKNIR